MKNYIKVLRDINKGKLPLVKEWNLQDVIDLNMFVFKLNHGYSFDINHPKTFSEKIQWYKFFYDNKEFAKITDKVLFKDYISKRIGSDYVIPMYGAWNNITDIEAQWEKLPEKFVLKSNLQGKGLNIKIIEKKSDIGFEAIKDELSEWLDPKHTLLNSCDWRMFDSKPMILAEEYVEDETGELRDYKFYCFDGKVPFFRIDCSRFEKHMSYYYDENNNVLNVSNVNNPPDFSKKVYMPATIKDMFDIASKLSVGFPHVRVDFYSVNNKIYLSELTFNQAGGMNPFKPREFDELLGSYFNLPISE